MAPLICGLALLGTSADIRACLPVSSTSSAPPKFCVPSWSTVSNLIHHFYVTFYNTVVTIHTNPTVFPHSVFMFAFWAVTPFSPIEVCMCFGGKNLLHLLRISVCCLLMFLAGCLFALLFNSEEWRIIFHRNVGEYLPDYTSWLPRTRYSSYVPLWEPQTHHCMGVPYDYHNK